MGSIIGVLTIAIFYLASLNSDYSTADVSKAYILYAYLILILILSAYFLMRPNENSIYKFKFLSADFLIYRKHHLYFDYKETSEICSGYLNFIRFSLILIAIYLFITAMYLQAFLSIIFYFASSGIIYLLNPVLYLSGNKKLESEILNKITNIQNINVKYKLEGNKDNSGNSVSLNEHESKNNKNKEIYYETLNIIFSTEIYPGFIHLINTKFIFKPGSSNPISDAISDAYLFLAKLINHGKNTSSGEGSKKLLLSVKYGLARLVVEKKIDLSKGVQAWIEFHNLDEGMALIENPTDEFMLQIKFASSMNSIRNDIQNKS